MTPAERERLAGLEQGSDDWHAARRGCVTASLAGRLLTVTERSLPSFVAAVRNDEGVVRDLSRVGAVARGVAGEPRARAIYEIVRSLEVRQVGLLVHAVHDLVRCSPDGLVEDGGMEIKRPDNLARHYGALAGVIPEGYVPQVPFSLWVSGLPWWDYVSFREDLPPAFRLAVVRAAPCTGMFRQFEHKVRLVLPYLDGGLNQ